MTAQGLDDRVSTREELRDVARSALTTRSSLTTVRENFEAGRTLRRDLWDLAGELGWLSFEAPERRGGGGVGFAESAVVLEELGRQVAAGPFLGHMVSTWAVCSSGSEIDEIASLVDGSRIATALPCLLSREGILEPRLQARSSDTGGTRVSVWGEEAFVPEIADAELALIAARDERGGLVVGVVEASQSRLCSVRSLDSLDRTRSLSSVKFDGIPMQVVARGSEAHALIRATHERLFTGVAIDSLALAERLMLMTVEYVNQREQFGRVVGTFQAVKHRCADMFVRVTTSRLAIMKSVDALESGQPQERAYWASAAKAYATSGAADIAGWALQLHGAIGFTWEHDLHFFMKRMKLNAELYGNPSAHRARVIRCLAPDSVTGVNAGGEASWL